MDTWVKSNWKRILKREGIPLDNSLKENVIKLIEKLRADTLEEVIIGGIDMSNYECDGNIAEDEVNEGNITKKNEESVEETKIVISIGSLPGIEEVKSNKSDKRIVSGLSEVEPMNDEDNNMGIMDSIPDEPNGYNVVLNLETNGCNFADDINERNCQMMELGEGNGSASDILKNKNVSF